MGFKIKNGEEVCFQGTNEPLKNATIDLHDRDIMEINFWMPIEEDIILTQNSDYETLLLS
jgi:hypothetical protein